MISSRELIRYVELELGPDVWLDAADRDEGRFRYEGRAIFGVEKLGGKEVRYALSALWDEARPLLFGIGLNPSRARADKGDKTVDRVLDLARENHGGLFWTNSGGQMETQAGTYVRDGRQSGPRNAEQLERVLNRLHPDELSRDVLIGWGHRGQTFGEWRDKAAIDRRINLFTVGSLLKGRPPHPQRYPGTLQLVPLPRL